MKKISFVFVTVLFCMSAVAAKLDMAPGLWEHSFSISGENPQMQQALAEMHKQLANLPPEQRKMMEEMMAAQGVSIGQEGTRVKACITQEQINRAELPVQDQLDCRQQVVEQSKNSYKITFACGDTPPTSGTAEFTFSDPKHYTATSVVTSAASGTAETLTIRQSGKWLTADCGNIQPVPN